MTELTEAEISSNLSLLRGIVSKKINMLKEFRKFNWLFFSSYTERYN